MTATIAPRSETLAAVVSDADILAQLLDAPFGTTYWIDATESVTNALAA